MSFSDDSDLKEVYDQSTELRKYWGSVADKIIEEHQEFDELQVLGISIYLDFDIKFIFSSRITSIFSLKYAIDKLTAEKLEHDMVFYYNKLVLDKL